MPACMIWHGMIGHDMAWHSMGWNGMGWIHGFMDACMFGWLYECLMVWKLFACLIHLVDWLIDWLIDWLTHGLTDGRIAWVTGWLIDWLIDCERMFLLQPDIPMLACSFRVTASTARNVTPCSLFLNLLAGYCSIGCSTITKPPGKGFTRSGAIIEGSP